MRPLKAFLSTVPAFLLIVCLQTACKKTDHLVPSGNRVPLSESVENRFFNSKAGEYPVIKAIKNNLLTQNKSAHFVGDLVSRTGYPLWNKARKYGKQQSVSMARAFVKGSYQFYYIPFTKDSSDFISAILIARVGPSDTVYKMLYHWQYADYGFIKTSDSLWAASDIFHIFANFQREVFGHVKFLI